MKVSSLLQVCLLAVTLALISQIGYCEYVECSKDTCPNLPVMVQFEHLNCTGAQRFFYLNETWNTCKDVTKDLERSESQRLYFTDAFYAIQTYHSRDCDKDLATPAPLNLDTHFFGMCRPYDFLEDPPSDSPIEYLGKMYLKNANQNFVSPQVPVIKPNVPDGMFLPIKCANETDCQAMSNFYVAEYRNQTCSSNPKYLAAVGMDANVCYRNAMDEKVYTIARCTGKHTYEVSFSINADCSRPYEINLEGATCRTGYYQTMFCHINIPPTTPPASDATKTQISALVVFIALVVLSSLL